MSRKVGKPIGIKPCGSQVLVELLSAQEVIGSQIIVNNQTKIETPEAIILAVGPSVDTEAWGFGVGDRVVFSAKVTMVRDCNDGDTRQKCLLEPQNIKGVLEEEF